MKYAIISFVLTVYSLLSIYFLVDHPALFLKHHLYTKYTKKHRTIVKQSKNEPILITQGGFYLVFYKGLSYNDFADSCSSYLKHWFEDEKEAKKVFNIVMKQFLIDVEDKKKKLEISHSNKKPYKILK